MSGWPRNPFAANQQSQPYPTQDWPKDPSPTAPDDEQPYRNPTYAVPGPRTPPNLGYWTGARTTVPLNPTPDPNLGWTDGVVARGFWQSTLLDLSPELRASASFRPVATPIMSTAAYTQKTEARLAVELESLGTFPGGNVRYEIRYIEYGSTTTPEATRQLTAPQDMTPDFYALGAFTEGGTLIFEGGTFIFKAPGHLRYWGVMLVIDQVGGALPFNDQRFPWTLRGVAQ